MQDYPKLLDDCKHVGYTSIDKMYCHSTMKNDYPSALAKYKQGVMCEWAGSLEANFYFANREMLRLCGAII